jgi:ankyrin repeat protein
MASMIVACVFFAAGCGGGVETKGDDSVYKAAENGDIGKITAAIRNGFNANTPDDDGMTLLHHAALGGKADIVESLTADYGADASLQDKQGRTALDLAVESGDAETIRILEQE